MKKTTFEKFESLAQSNMMVPVYLEVLADMETPVSILKRFKNDETMFLLESVDGGEQIGRYSFLGVEPKGIFSVEKNKAFYAINGEKNEINYKDYPLDALRELTVKKNTAYDEDVPPLSGGAIGFVSYEAVGMFEKLPEAKEVLDVPEALFMITDKIIAFDNLKHTIKIIVNVECSEHSSTKAAYDYAMAEIEQLKKIVTTPLPIIEKKQKTVTDYKLQSNITKEEYMDMVVKAKEYIHNGDIIQVVLSQRMNVEIDIDTFEIYRSLRFVNPSPYMYYIKFNDLIIIGSSPETLVKFNGVNSTVRPIAGTRKRGKTPQQDRDLANELLQDEKEKAEHLMLVDLGRNDLGRTAVKNSVQVKSFMNVERYSHVMHLVSDVEAILAKEYDAFDLLKTTFPAGTLSGAPKIRAMEIINELEKNVRGIYGGAVGYISYDGKMDMAIVIRTIIARKKLLSMQAGAGIVHDSKPELEYEETINKMMGLVEALKLASAGL